MPVAAPAAPRPYRDYLTPALHQRFIKASKYTLVLCYAIAILMEEWEALFWPVLPFLGRTTIRALLIYIPALIIYVLRVAQWHVGSRQTLNPFTTFRSYTLRKSTVVTFSAYAFSAWLFAEVYIWSRPVGSQLTFTDSRRSYERIKLNERPLFVRFLFQILGAAQASVHLWNDWDKIEAPGLKPRKEREEPSTTGGVSNPRIELLGRFPKLLANSGIIAVTATVAGSFIYFLGPRQWIWQYYYNTARRFLSIAKTSKPVGVQPFLPLMTSFVAEAVLLVFLWHFVNSAFDVYVTQEPLKNLAPITNESNDPNGTLLNGLKSKKDPVRAIALWELALITDRFPDRRKTIFTEIERKKAPTAAQITSLCIAELNLLTERINHGLNPNIPPPSATPAQPAAPAAKPKISLVPQIAAPLKPADGLVAPLPKSTTSLGRAGVVLDGLARNASSPVNSRNAYGRDALNATAATAQQGVQHAESLFTRFFNALIASRLGWPFRASFQSSAAVYVLGAPYSRHSQLCNAVTALANLAVVSLKEDGVGRFHHHVPAIIRALTSTITSIDAYLAKSEIHWSDFATLSKPEAERRSVEDVQEVRECARVGLEKVVGGFNEFLEGMGMGRLEVVEARKLVGTGETKEKAVERKGPEMQQASARR